MTKKLVSDLIPKKTKKNRITSNHLVKMHKYRLYIDFEIRRCRSGQFLTKIIYKLEVWLYTKF